MNVFSKWIIPGLLVYGVTFFLICIYNDYSISFLLPIAPIIFGFVFGIVYTKKRSAFNSIVVLIIFASWFLRLVLIPCIYVMSGYVSKVQTSAGTDNLNEAVLLVGFEFITVGLYLVLNKKISIIHSTSQEVGAKNSNKTITFTKLMIVVLLIIAILCITKERLVLSSISTIFNKLINSKEDAIERRRSFLWVRSNSSFYFELFINAVYYLQILIPATLISHIINKNNSIRSTSKGYWGCVLISASSVLITTDNNSDSVCILIACIVVIISTYRNSISHHVPILIGSVFVFVVYFLFTKSGNGNKLSEVSTTLCAYFSALPNVSAGFDMKYTSKISTLFGDIVSGVPYMSAFFRGYPKSVIIYNEIVHGYSGAVNQIVPLIVSGYKFFGLFAPILTILTYNIALKMEIKMRKSGLVFNQLLFSFFVVSLATSPCLYGMPSIIKRLCHFIPLIILANINERVSLAERINTYDDSYRTKLNNDKENSK